MADTSLAVVPQDDAPANTPVSTPEPAARPYVDPDDRALEEAEAAVAAEEAARQAGNTAPAPAAPSQQAPATNPAPADPQTPPPMIPLPRFNELLERARRAEAAAMYEAGRANALEARIANGPGQQPAPADAPPARPPEHIEAEAIESEYLKVAEDFDNGAITAVEKAKAEVPLLARLLKLHVGSAVQAMTSAIDARLREFQPQPGVVDQQVMAQQTAQLAKDHPWITQATDKEINALVSLAKTEALALGSNPYTPGAAGTMALRKRIAELASVYMPQWRPGQQPPAATAPAAPAANQPQPPAPPPAPANRPNGADVVAALARQAAHPPTTPSSHGQATGPLTLDRIDTMSDAELDRLPTAEIDRLLGVQV